MEKETKTRTKGDAFITHLNTRKTVQASIGHLRCQLRRRAARWLARGRQHDAAHQRQLDEDRGHHGDHRGGVAFQTNILALNAASSSSAAKEIKDPIATSVDRIRDGSALAGEGGGR
ncbi:hypothetical protein OKW40_003533 [Paraburkholderia sp. RAU6.4a]